LRTNKVTFGKIDWWLVILYFVLTVTGLLNIYSASYDPEHPLLYDTSEEYGKQFMWYCISLGLAGTILLLEGTFIRAMAIPSYIVCLFLLVLVLLIGKEVNGAKAWFGFGSIGIQPSEFAKVALSLMLAWFLSSSERRNTDHTNLSRSLLGAIVSIGGYFGLPLRFLALFSWTQLYVFLIIAVPAGIILLQPDMGTVIVFTGFILMLYREGLSGSLLLYGIFMLILAISTLMLKETTVELPLLGPDIPGKYVILIMLGFVSILALLAVLNLVIKKKRRGAIVLVLTAWLVSSTAVWGVDYAFEKLSLHQKERIEITLGLREDPDGKGYNIDRSMAAIGSGGLTGKGYKKATLANKSQKHVPMASTDFIFCTWSEEWGFIGSFLILFLFMFLLVRLIMIAERQRVGFTRIYAYCVASIFFMHVLVNMGMAIGLMPVIGIPLPFFSYGGSSLMAFTILLFLLIRLDAERLDVLK
jgi:rod shape determining protein RodA